MSRDLHNKPFDEGTNVKLAIFKDYLKEWLPVFLAKKEIIWNTVNIYDFFAGPGCDSNNNQGTPLIILHELENYKSEIQNKSLNVNIFFNEYDKIKFNALNENIAKYLNNDNPYTIKTENLDFKICFNQEYPEMLNNKNSANLIFLDQTGIKQITAEIFNKIIQLKTTDFIFFISSSTIKRFTEHPAIQAHIKLSPEEIALTPYHKIHRIVVEYYKSLIPIDKKYYLGSFSLKKNAGLYGLVFGSNHLLGMEKFLNTCWAIDPERGEANFDIDGDNIKPLQIDMFTNEVKKPKKVEIFEKEVKELIVQKIISSDEELYLFTILSGFRPLHSRKIIDKLVKEKIVLPCTLNLTHNIVKPNFVKTKINLK
jgi:three-Cys-motif partner protein